MRSANLSTLGDLGNHPRLQLAQIVSLARSLGFFAGFTFTVIVTAVADPSPKMNLTLGSDDGADNAARARKSHVRFCLALSWVLFVLSLAMASFAALLFNANRRWFSDDLKRNVMAQVYRNEMWDAWERLDKEEKQEREIWLRTMDKLNKKEKMRKK